MKIKIFADKGSFEKEGNKGNELIEKNESNQRSKITKIKKEWNPMN